MKKKYNCLIIIFVFVLFTVFFKQAHAYRIDIIVNKTNSIDEISFKDLSKIFMMKRRYWENGTKIYPIMQEAGSPEKEIVLKKIYKMNDKLLKKYWITEMFKGEITSFPKSLSSNESVKRFVSQAPNAIGYIDSGFSDDTVKVLKIDGKLSIDDGYILKDGE